MDGHKAESQNLVEQLKDAHLRIETLENDVLFSSEKAIQALHYELQEMKLSYEIIQCENVRILLSDSLIPIGTTRRAIRGVIDGM